MIKQLNMGYFCFFSYLLNFIWKSKILGFVFRCLLHTNTELFVWIVSKKGLCCLLRWMWSVACSASGLGTPTPRWTGFMWITWCWPTGWQQKPSPLKGAASLWVAPHRLKSRNTEKWFWVPNLKFKFTFEDLFAFGSEYHHLIYIFMRTPRFFIKVLNNRGMKKVTFRFSYLEIILIYSRWK